MCPTLEWRRGQSADVDAIRAVTREAYAKWVPLIGREPKPMTADYGSAIQAHRFDLLYADGALAGLIETVDEADRLLIENVAVRPAFQGQGLGRRLMARAEDVAMTLGRDRIRLYTNQRFEENIRLYASLGYKLDREEQISVGVVVHMSKALQLR